MKKFVQQHRGTREFYKQSSDLNSFKLYNSTAHFLLLFSITCFWFSMPADDGVDSKCTAVCVSISPQRESGMQVLLSPGLLFTATN